MSTYTINGRADHAATASTLYPDPGGPVTLTCACGWSQTGRASDDAQPDDTLVEAWAAHVYEATGQRLASAEADDSGMYPALCVVCGEPARVVALTDPGICSASCLYTLEAESE